MSDIAKSFAKSRLATYPPDVPIVEEGGDEDGSSSASSVSSTGTIVAPAALQRQLPAPVIWSKFFEQELYLGDFESQQAKYHVLYNKSTSTTSEAVIVLQHGAGSCAMSWALCAKELKGLLPNCDVLAVEAREHGSMVWHESGEIDTRMHLDLLAADLVKVIHLTKEKLKWPELPRLVLVGHSLGGAIVTQVARTGSLGSKLIGFGVLDVVEGSAMEALQHMKAYLTSRPSSFHTIESAVEWHLRSRTLRNIESARASVPPLFIQSDTGEYRWRTNLSRTESYWENWFNGMSSKFLAASGAKVLILAGTDRLDKELMIGQMQGKFQLHVLPEAGHFVQEDAPQKTACLIAEFFRRNDQSSLILPPKVSEMLARGEKV